MVAVLGEREDQRGGGRRRELDRETGGALALCSSGCSSRCHCAIGGRAARAPPPAGGCSHEMALSAASALSSQAVRRADHAAGANAAPGWGRGRPTKTACCVGRWCTAALHSSAPLCSRSSVSSPRAVEEQGASAQVLPSVFDCQQLIDARARARERELAQRCPARAKLQKKTPALPAFCSPYLRGCHSPSDPLRASSSSKSC